MRARRGIAAVIVGALLTACGSGGSTDPATDGAERPAERADTARDPHTGPADDETATDRDRDHATTPTETTAAEHGAPQPRLIVTGVDSGEVAIIDVATAEVVATLELGDHVHGHGAAITSDGRYLLAPHDDGVSIVDAGSWAVPHGAHVDHYTSTPVVVGHLDGPNPSHLVSVDGVSALFFDGDGTTTVLDQAGFDHGDLDVLATIDSGTSHHGFTVPVDDGYVVTVPTDDMEDMPNVVGATDITGTVLAEFDCENTHGETDLEAGAAAACQTGVLLVTPTDDGWEATLVAYPEVDDEDPYGYGDARAWVLSTSAGSERIVAPLGTRHVLHVDPIDAEATALPLDENVALFGVGGDRDSILVLTTDGILRRLDPDDGATLDEVQAIDPFVEGDPDEPYRRLVVAGDHVFVSDPAARQLVEVTLDGDLVVERVLPLELTPGFVGVAGG